jgi:hypothetical protein
METGTELGQVIQQLNQIDRRLHRMETARLIMNLRHSSASSAHSPEFLQQVVDYYGKGRICFLSQTFDPGNQNLGAFEQVMAAHILPASQVELYWPLNNDGMRYLAADKPYSCILLQRKFEKLLDKLAWCLIPLRPLDNPLEVTVKVLIRPDMADQYSSFKCSMQGKDKPGKDKPPVDHWIEELMEYNGKTIQFQPGKTPSFRALAEHARHAFLFARSAGWISEEDLENFEVFGDLSPVISQHQGSNE